MSLWQWFTNRSNLILQIKEMEERVEHYKKRAREAEDDYYKERAASDLAEEYHARTNALMAAEHEIEELKRVVLSQAVELESVRRKG